MTIFLNLNAVTYNRSFSAKMKHANSTAVRLTPESACSRVVFPSSFTSTSEGEMVNLFFRSLTYGKWKKSKVWYVWYTGDLMYRVHVEQFVNKPNYFSFFSFFSLCCVFVYGNVQISARNRNSIKLAFIMWFYIHLFITS